MDALPAFGLANTMTGFATLFAGLACLVLARALYPHPARWRFAYWMIVVTGVFTVTLHGFGETRPVWGPPWFWSFLDTGSNIVVAWALGLAILGDYYSEAARRRGRVILTLAMVVGVAWHFVDRLPSTERAYLVPLGSWGGFYPGETWLIALSWVTVGLFVARRGRIPPPARPLLLGVFVLFFGGMLLATARNDVVVFPFLALHALWHLVGAFAFVGLWAFNHVRFTIEDATARATAPASGLPAARAASSALLILLLAGALAACAAAGPEGEGRRTAGASATAAEAEGSPLSDMQRAAGVVLPEVGDRVRPGGDPWFACSSQKLVMAAWFARLARHVGALRALFDNEGEGIDCVWLDPDDPSVESIQVVGASDDRLGAATIRHLKVRIDFAKRGGERRPAVELFTLAGVAGGLEVVR